MLCEESNIDEAKRNLILHKCVFGYYLQSTAISCSHLEGSIEGKHILYVM